jgi:hypothetical protein
MITAARFVSKDGMGFASRGFGSLKRDVTGWELPGQLQDFTSGFA